MSKGLICVHPKLPKSLPFTTRKSTILPVYTSCASLLFCFCFSSGRDPEKVLANDDFYDDILSNGSQVAALFTTHKMLLFRSALVLHLDQIHRPFR